MTWTLKLEASRGDRTACREWGGHGPHAIPPQAEIAEAVTSLEAELEAAANQDELPEGGQGDPSADEGERPTTPTTATTEATAAT